MSVQAHHIVYRSQGGTHTLENLILLCPEHHMLVHSNKRVWMPLLKVTLELGERGMRVLVPQAERWLGKGADGAPTLM